MHAGRAPVSPSIRGNAWARDRGSQEGLKEAGGQQRFRKLLCSPSRNVAKALIPLWLTITLKLFLSTLVSGCTGDNHITRHHGAGGTHRAGAKLGCATCRNLIATSTSEKRFLLMPSLTMSRDPGCPLARGSLKGDSAGETAQWVWSAPMGWDRMGWGPCQQHILQKTQQRVEKQHDQRDRANAARDQLHAAAGTHRDPLRHPQPQDPPRTRGQIGCFEASPKTHPTEASPKTHPTALSIAPSPTAQHSHAQALVPPTAAAPAPRPPRPPPVINRHRHLHSSQSGGYGARKAGSRCAAD